MKQRERQEHLDRISDDASAWFERLQDPGPGTNEAFAAWLKASAENVYEFLQIASLRNDLCDLGEDPNLEQLIEAATASEDENVVSLFESQTAELPVLTRVPRRWFAGSVVAAVVAATIILGVFELALDADSFQTAIGEQTSFPLPDGSMVTLNTQSRIELQFTDTYRDVVLSGGEVLFDVAKDPQRPFRVVAGDTIIQALGTAFNVYHRNAGTTVTVVEGTIEVRSRQAQALPVQQATDLPVIVTVGQQASVDVRSRRIAVVETDPERATAWRERRLFFDNRPLSEVIDEFNLYNDPPIVIADADLETLPVTGSFNANDRASFILFLEKIGIATASVEHDGRISLRQKEARPSEN